MRLALLSWGNGVSQPPSAREEPFLWGCTCARCTGSEMSQDVSNRLMLQNQESESFHLRRGPATSRRRRRLTKQCLARVLGPERAALCGVSFRDTEKTPPRNARVFLRSVSLIMGRCSPLGGEIQSRPFLSCPQGSPSHPFWPSTQDRAHFCTVEKQNLGGGEMHTQKMWNC